MKEGYFVIKTVEAGDIGEKTKFFVPGKRPDSKLSRKQKNAIRKAEQNEYSAVKRLARLIHANFTAGDIFLGLDYSEAGYQKLMEYGRKHDLPVDDADETVARDAVWEAACKMMENGLRRVKRKLGKEEKELTAIYCTSDMDGSTGELVRVHHHLIVKAGAEKAFLSAWEEFGLGTVSWSPLWENQIDRTPLAEYIIRQVRRIPDAKKYRGTKNLKQPKVKMRIVETDNELLVPRGGKLVFRREYGSRADARNDFVGYQPQYIRYITPAALRRMEQKRQCG